MWYYFFLFDVTAGGLRWGVDGRPEFIPLYWYFAFFSDGFRIWKFKEKKIGDFVQHTFREGSENLPYTEWKINL